MHAHHSHAVPTEVAKIVRIGFRRHARNPLAVATGERVVLCLAPVRFRDDAVTTGLEHGSYSVCVTVVITVLV